MNVAVAAIVLFAALLHALWNAIVKGADDKTVVLGLIALGHVVPGIGMVALSPAPVAAAIPYVAASTIIHWGYYYLLNTAYRGGDLSVIYPIARGFAPVLIAIGAQIWVQETLPPLVWMGILAVSAGIMLLASGVIAKGVASGGLVAALGVAICVAAYSLVDGVGVRLSGSAMGYIGWLFISEIFVVIFVFSTRWGRVVNMQARTIWLGVVGGVVSGSAYALVLYAKTLAPLGVVSALRETSVVFAALIGVLWFGERPRRTRLIAASVVGSGVILIGYAG